VSPVQWSNQTVKITTNDLDQKVYFRIFEESDPNTILAEASFVLKSVFEKVPSFKRSKEFIIFTVYEKSWGGQIIATDGSKIGRMSCEMMYRCSDFTSNPRGRLFLSVKDSKNCSENN
jgi:hypothetical protein